MLVSPVSGVYGSNQLLVVESTVPGESLHYAFRDPSGADGPWIPLRGPLELGAAPGEVRDYRLAVRVDTDGAVPGERRDLSYRIDRRVPAAPRIQPAPGTYWDPVTVRFDAAPGDTVCYSVQGDVVRDPVTWDGKGVAVGALDERAQYVVQAYTVNATGTRSRIVTSRYVLDTRAPVLDVLSPVPGTFANAQALALTFRNLQWVRYTLDGTDPAAGGTPYTGPVTIDRQGTVTVKVAGMPRAAKRGIVRREVTVTYAPAPGTGLQLDTASGTYPAGVSPAVLSSPGGTLYYTLWEKTPNDSDPMVTSRVAVSAKTGGPAPVTLRLRALSDAGRWGPEYRFFFFVGAGAPSAPEIRLDGGEPVRAAAQAQVIAPEDTLAAVTLDGRAPDPGQPAEGTWIDVRASNGSTALVIRAAAVDGAGLVSPVTGRRVSFAAAAGSPPGFTLAPGAVQGTAVLSPAAASAAGSANAAGAVLVYELTSDGTDPAVPGPDSPALVSPVRLEVPFGAGRTFKARVAALDGSGRVTGVSGVASLKVDHAPPEAPRLAPAPGAVLDEPAVVSFASSGKVYFSLTSDGSMPSDPDLSSSPSNTFAALPGVEGAAVTYRLKLAAVDSAGNATEVYGPLLYTVDLTAPVIPPITGIADGGHYAARQVSPVLEGEHAWSVRYTAASDGSEPPEPGLKSPELTSATTFSGEEGAVTQWRLKLLAISHNGKRVGERRSLTFYLDLQPPPVPRLVGLPAEGRIARPVSISAEPVPADARVVYTLTSDGSEPADPLVSGTPLPASLTLDAADGTRRDFVIRVAAVDAAGNKSLSDRRYQLTVDRELPPDPVIRGADDGSVSTRTVTLTLQSASAQTVFEMTEDGSIPRLPTAGSRLYSGPLLLVGKTAEAVTYRILARAINDLGMASRAARVFSVTVDRSVPPAPPQPSLVFSEGNPAVAYLAWSAPETGRVLYRLESGGDFAPADGPVSVAVDPDRGSTVRGEAVFESASGVRGASTAFSLAVGRRLLAPVFRGARDGAPTAQAVQLRCGAPEGEVRYETSTDGSFPPAVTALSAPFPDALPLDAADGQTVEVTVAARAFDPSGRSIPSEETVFHAVVDRTPPDAPRISGVEDGGHYQDQRSVSLLSPEGSIYDAVTTGADTVLPAQTDSNRYDSPLVLDAPAGESVTYRIVAFSVDAAGNRSREVRSWTVTIDRKVVYASPDGSDYSDGSRDAPVRSISRAVDLAQAGPRRTIFAAAGTYPADGGISLSSDLTLVGGLDPRTWEPLGLERWSTLAFSDRWKGGSPLLAMTAGSVSIRGFELSGAPSIADSLLSVSGGQLTLSRGAVTLPAQGRGAALRVAGGSLVVQDAQFRAGGSWAGSFVAAGGGALEMSGTRMTGPSGSSDFAAVDLSGGASAVVKGSTVDPGSGLRTRGIRSNSSTLTVSSSWIGSGAGSIEAVALDGRQSTVTVDNADIVAAAAARFPAAVVSAGGALRVTRSRISLSGAASAVGVNASGGDVVLLRNTVKAADTREYLSLVRLEDARAVLANNLLVGASAGQSVDLQVRGGSTDVLNNTIVAGTGTTITAAILVQGDAVPRLVNNVITRKGAEAGSAIAILNARSLLAGASPSAPVMLSNSFGGWKRVLHVEYGAAAAPLDVTAVDGLNRADAVPFGGSVAGNISEAAGTSFAAGSDSYGLSRASACLDAGVDLAAPQGPGGTGAILLVSASEVTADLLGSARPGPLPLAVPGPPRGWDIGAYELVE